jgi:hypothetical protein
MFFRRFVMRPRKTIQLPAGLAVCLLVFTTSCTDGAFGRGGGSGAPVEPSSLTYWNDIAPIINDKCVKCHQPGGIGPFPLDSYEQVRRMAPTIATVIKVKYMPPYLVTHDGSCGQFDDSAAVSADQLARIDAWAKSDRNEGTRASITRPLIPGITDGDEYLTPSIVPQAQGTSNEEYRCYPLGTQRGDDGFITAYDIRPSNEALVYHVMAFLVDPDRTTGDGRSNAAVMQALDDRDPDRPGWPCLGTAGEGVELEAIPAIWAHGTGPVTYPAKVGVFHKKTAQVVVQVYYSVAGPRLAGLSESTAVRFRYASSVDRRAFLMVQDPFVDTLARVQPDVLPAGRMETTYTWNQIGRELGIPAAPGASLLGLMPHMHSRGLREQVTLAAAGSTGRCAAEIQQWNPGWQRFYFYAGTPPAVTADTQIQFACTYNTASDTTPVLPGGGSSNEMCSAIFMLALPGGQ